MGSFHWGQRTWGRSSKEHLQEASRGKGPKEVAEERCSEEWGKSGGTEAHRGQRKVKAKHAERGQSRAEEPPLVRSLTGVQSVDGTSGLQTEGRKETHRLALRTGLVRQPAATRLQAAASTCWLVNQEHSHLLGLLADQCFQDRTV